MVSNVLCFRQVLLLNFYRVCAVKGKAELVVCFGELLIDFVPTVGGLSLADAPAFKKAPGGAPANVAVGIAKLGGNAAFVGKVNCLTIFEYEVLKIII